MWGNYAFDYACSMARGLKILEDYRWETVSWWKYLRGPQDHVSKLALWNRLTDFMHHHNGSYIMFGDMMLSENAKKVLVGLVDLPIGGRSFTWMNKACTKLSKLDRFLISEDVTIRLLDVRITALDMLWSDHNPILLHIDKTDFGPTLFKLYNSWLLKDGFDNLIKEEWELLDSNLKCHEKFRRLKDFLTDEFKFGKGLKQGDPLSPFLFILIMETLHLSFQRVVDAGMFHGGNMHRLKSWDDTIGGRLTLVKSVLGSMPIFHMSLFKVPSGILRSLESIRSKFFNGIDGSKNKASWVQWSKALASKDNGGLGNEASTGRWEYRRNREECNREMTHFWDDNWCEGGRLKDRFPRIYALEECKDITVGSKLAQPSITQSFRRMPRGGVEQMQVDDLINLVQNISLIPMQDRWTWTLNLQEFEYLAPLFDQGDAFLQFFIRICQAQDSLGYVLLTFLIDVPYLHGLEKLLKDRLPCGN
ncbi:RNA-directed DNA polymerase, eukaryota, reverse transcriptase zinc-binding domain protein [Tanacetum coccineum]